MSEQHDPEPYLGTCPNIHPHGASYSLQHRQIHDGLPEGERQKPRALLCPWCDFRELKLGDREEFLSTKVVSSRRKALHR